MRASIRYLLSLVTLITVASGCSEPTGTTRREVVPTLPTPDPPPPVTPAPTFVRHIFLAGRSGGDRQQLARGFSPAWSPDGSRIAFVDHRSGGYAIYVMDADGTAERQLTSANGDAGMPRWSPDGGRIAFMQSGNGLFLSQTCEWDISSCFGEIRVINADGSNEATLARNALLMGWSPDGKKIAFVDGLRTALNVVNADGTNLTKITQFGGVSSVDWSPDGSRIALGAAGSVYVMNADGSGLSRLTDEADSLIVYRVGWSPRGDKIAFNVGLTVGPWEFHIDLNSFKIQVINPDGTNRITLAADALNPRWLLDGRSLSFSRLYDNGIWIVAANGGEPSVMLPDVWPYDVAWSPTGDRFTFSAHTP